MLTAMTGRTRIRTAIRSLPLKKEQKQPPKSGKKDKNTSKKKLKREKKQKENRGKLIMDATVAPADIKYPTDIDLLNKSREHLENRSDHSLERSIAQGS